LDKNIKQAHIFISFPYSFYVSYWCGGGGGGGVVVGFGLLVFWETKELIFSKSPKIVLGTPVSSIL
jgi:D-serine dehydratase